MIDEPNSDSLQEQEMDSDIQAAANEMERQNKSRLLETLAEFGIQVDQAAIDKEDKKKDNPLGALEDFSEATTIPIPGLHKALAPLEDEPDPLRREGSGLFSQAASNRQNLAQTAKVEQDPWSREVSGLGRVTATEEHRDIYEDVFFSDESLQLPIPLTIGSRKVIVTCRSLSGYEKEIIAIAVRNMAESHPLLKSAPQIVLSEYITRANMLMMVVDVDGEAWPCIRCEPAPGTHPGNDPQVGILVEKMTSEFAKTQGRKFALLHKALQMFEVITDILDDAEINGDFTNPAG